MTPPDHPDDSPDIDDVELLDALEALGADDGPLAGILGGGGMPDLGSLLIFAGAALALFRFQFGVIPVIFVCGALGMLMRLSAG